MLIIIDGVSLTHSQSPCQHIWTFAINKTAFDRQGVPAQDQWSCTSLYSVKITSVKPEAFYFYSDDPLWDGQGCGGTNTCCEFNNPPWFCKQLPQPTTDDIELRLCGDEG